MIQEHLLPRDEDVAFYEEHGYWLGGKVLDDQRLERLRNAMYRIWAAEFETGKEPWGGPWRLGENPLAVRKMDQAHWTNMVMRELATDPTIGAMAARLARAQEIRLWHDQLLYKPGQGPGAKGGGNVGWHQDHHYWQCAPTNLLTAWVAFDDVTLENGCMQVVPGSQKWGLLDANNFFEQDLDAMKATIEEQTGKEFRTAPCTLKAGEVSFHHCLTIHGSGPNFTNRPRRSLVLHLQPGDAVWSAGTECDAHMNVLLMKELGRKPGEKFEGQYWPKLYPQVA